MVLAEITDQNFVEEDIEGDKVSYIRSGKREKKRLDVDSTSSNDQVILELFDYNPLSSQLCYYTAFQSFPLLF